MAKHFPAAQWRNWFLEFEQSDLTVARFCDSIGVSVQSYYKWRKRFRDLESDAKSDGCRHPEFIPVVVASTMITIELLGGVIARVPNDVASLRPILSVLLHQESAQ